MIYYGPAWSSDEIDRFLESYGYGMGPQVFCSHHCIRCDTFKLQEDKTPALGACRMELSLLHRRALGAFGELVRAKAGVALWADEEYYDWKYRYSVEVSVPCLLDDSEANLGQLRLTRDEAADYHRKHGDPLLVTVSPPNNARYDSWEDFPETEEWLDFPDFTGAPDIKILPRSFFIASFFSGLTRKGFSPDPVHLALPDNFCEAAAKRKSPEAVFDHDEDCWTLKEEFIEPVFSNFLDSPLSLIEDPSPLELFGDQLWSNGFRAASKVELKKLLWMGSMDDGQSGDPPDFPGEP